MSEATRCLGCGAETAEHTCACMPEHRSIMEIADEIGALSDFILRPYLYNHHGVRLCDFGYKHGPYDVSVAVIDGEHHCQMCLDEKMREEQRDAG